MIQYQERLGRIRSFRAGRIRFLKSEDRFVRRVDYDPDLFRPTTTRRKEFLESNADCQDAIGRYMNEPQAAERRVRLLGKSAAACSCFSILSGARRSSASSHWM